MQVNDEQRKKIEALAYKNAKVTFAQIRIELKLQDKPHIRFNLCSYDEKNPEYNKKLICSIQREKPEFEEKHKLQIVDIYTGDMTILDEEIKEIFRKRKETWKNAKKLYVYYSDIRKQLNIPDNFRFMNLSGYTKSEAEIGGKAKYVKQFEYKETFIELKGYHKIKKAVEENSNNEKWEQIKNDTKKLETIAEALTYHKSDETRSKYLKDKGIVDEDIIAAALTIRAYPNNH